MRAVRRRMSHWELLGVERPGEDQPHPRGAPRTLTHDPGIVVVGQHALAQGHQQPEGLLLTAVEEEHRGHDVHGLQGRHSTAPLSVAVWPQSKTVCPFRKEPASSNKKQPLTNPGKSANKPICKKSMRQRQPASFVKVGQKALRKQRQDISQHFT